MERRKSVDASTLRIWALTLRQVLSDTSEVRLSGCAVGPALLTRLGRLGKLAVTLEELAVDIEADIEELVADIEAVARELDAEGES